MYRVRREVITRVITWEKAMTTICLRSFKRSIVMTRIGRILSSCRLAFARVTTRPGSRICSLIRSWTMTVIKMSLRGLEIPHSRTNHSRAVTSQRIKINSEMLMAHSHSSVSLLP